MGHFKPLLLLHKSIFKNCLWYTEYLKKNIIHIVYAMRIEGLWLYNIIQNKIYSADVLFRKIINGMGFHTYSNP